MQDNTNHLFALLTHADAPISHFYAWVAQCIGCDPKTS